MELITEILNSYPTVWAIAFLVILAVTTWIFPKLRWLGKRLREIGKLVYEFTRKESQSGKGISAEEAKRLLGEIAELVEEIYDKYGQKWYRWIFGIKKSPAEEKD